MLHGEQPKRITANLGLQSVDYFSSVNAVILSSELLKHLQFWKLGRQDF